MQMQILQEDSIRNTTDWIHLQQSRTTYHIMFNNCLIFSHSKLQTEIALSTTEAEYICLSHALRTVLVQGTVHENQKLQIHATASSDHCIWKLAKAPKMGPRTKHINIKYHHFRQAIAKDAYWSRARKVSKSCNVCSEIFGWCKKRNQSFVCEIWFASGITFLLAVDMAILGRCWLRRPQQRYTDNTDNVLWFDSIKKSAHWLVRVLSAREGVWEVYTISGWLMMTVMTNSNEITLSTNGDETKQTR